MKVLIFFQKEWITVIKLSSILDRGEERILEVVNWFQTEIRKLPNRKTYFRYPTHTIYCEKNNI